MAEDLNERLQQAASGTTPQTKPDERRRFLGSLRERTLVRMTVAQTADPHWQQEFLKHLNDYQRYSILVNGKMPQNQFINQLMGQASQKGIKFTLINDETAKNEADATGVLVVAKNAINQYRIEIDQVYAPTVSSAQIAAPKKNKTSFWQKLFGKEK